jgi:hypothetical protein
MMVHGDIKIVPDLRTVVSPIGKPEALWQGWGKEEWTHRLSWQSGFP